MKKKFLAYALFYAAVFSCLLLMLGSVLAGWEAHGLLVRYTPDFFALDKTVPLHTLLLCVRFLAQFSYYPALGAALYALLFCLVAFLANTLSGMFATVGEDGIRHRPLLPGMLVSACLLPCFATTFCAWPLLFICLLGGGVIWCGTLGSKPVLRLSVRAILLIFLSFLIREYILLSAVLFILTEVEKADGRPWWRTCLRASGILLGVAAAGLAFRQLWLPYNFFSKDTVWILLFPAGSAVYDIPFRCFLAPNFAVFILWFACLSAFALPFLHRLDRLPKPWRKGAAALALALAVAPFFFVPASARNIKTFFEADALMREWKWNEALELLDADFERQSRQGISTEFVMHTTQLKCALLATRQATEKIFSYKNPTFPALFPNPVIESVEPYTLAVYYGYTGQFAEALHTNYDFITGRIINAAVLNEIIRTELIYNNPVASKFTYMLETSLFRRREAARNYRLESAKMRRDLERARELISNEDFGVKAYMPDLNLYTRGFKQQQNIYFYEYFVTLLLIQKNYHAITYDYKRLQRFYPNRLPRLVQEALMANFNYSPDRIDYPLNPKGVSPEVLRDYWDFIYDEQSYRNGGMDFDTFVDKWYSTFWFYHLYMITRNEQIR